MASETRYFLTTQELKTFRLGRLEEDEDHSETADQVSSSSSSSLWSSEAEDADALINNIVSAVHEEVSDLGDKRSSNNESRLSSTFGDGIMLVGEVEMGETTADVSSKGTVVMLDSSKGLGTTREVCGAELEVALVTFVQACASIGLKLFVKESKNDSLS